LPVLGQITVKVPFLESHPKLTGGGRCLEKALWMNGFRNGCQKEASSTTVRFSLPRRDPLGRSSRKCET